VAVPRNPSFTWELGKSAFLGGRYESFKAGDPNQPNYRVQDLSSDADAKQAARRDTLLKAVDSLAQKVEGNDQIATYDEFHARGSGDGAVAGGRERVRDRPRIRKKLRDRYGRTTAGQSMLLARRLVESGVRFVTVNYAGWDHHAKIFEGLDKKLPEFDQAVSALGRGHERPGTFENTLLVVMGEFGRTPKINKDAGRDHWGQAASLLFAGAGVKPGSCSARPTAGRVHDPAPGVAGRRGVHDAGRAGHRPAEAAAHARRPPARGARRGRTRPRAVRVDPLQEF
jgi:hypothetical protein